MLFISDCYLVCFFQICRGPLSELDFTFAVNFLARYAVTGPGFFPESIRFHINLGMKLSEHGNTKSQSEGSSNQLIHLMLVLTLVYIFWNMVFPCNHIVIVSLMDRTYYYRM